MRSRRGIFAAALFGVGLLAFVSGAITVVYANTLHQSPPIAWNASGFGSGDCPSLAAGQVLWHFVHTQTKKDNLPSTLTATFSTAGSVAAQGFTNGNSVVMYNVITGRDTLTGASDTISNGGNLNLSSICVGPPPPLPSPSPSQKPSPSPSHGPSPTPSEKPSPTPSEKPTPTPSEKPSPTPSEKPTPTPSEKPSPTPSEKPTPTPSEKPTPTPSERPTPTPSEHPSPSPSEVPSASPSPSPSPTPTPAASPSPSPAVGGGGVSGATTTTGTPTGEVLAETGAYPAGSGLGFGLMGLGLIVMAAGALAWRRRTIQ